METDFLASGYHFFLLFSDGPATASFIFPLGGNVFLNKTSILVSGKVFSGFLKPFFIYFWDIFVRFFLV